MMIRTYALMLDVNAFEIETLKFLDYWIEQQEEVKQAEFVLLADWE